MLTFVSSHCLYVCITNKKSIIMKKNFKVTLLCTLLFSSLFAQKLTTAKAIDMAGKQRMLINRIAKNYMAVGANVRTEVANADLDETTSLFNENHRELLGFVKSKEALEALNYLDILWKEFRMKVTSEPNLINAETVILETRVITNAANSVVEKIEKEAFVTTNSSVVNNSGKQRMLLQRISTLLIAKSWGVNYVNLDRDLKEAIIAFEANLGNLHNTKENSEEIKSALAFQKSEWDYIKNTFNSENLKPVNVYSSTNVMTKEFDKITGLYTKMVEEGRFKYASK